MPLSHKQTSSDFTLVLWYISEPEDFFLQKISLSAAEQIFFQKISNSKRRREWLTTRYILQNELNVFDTIKYYPTGKPFLPDRFISISHSFEMVGVIVSENLCSLDIEKINPRILKVSHRVFTPQELAFAKTVEQLTVCWCCKETVFKFYDDQNVDFKRDIAIEPVSDFNEGNLAVHYLKKNHYFVNIKLKTINDFKVTWLTAPITI